MSAAIQFFVRDSKNEFETAVVNKPSVFKPLKFYCIVELEFFLSKYYSLHPIHLHANVTLVLYFSPYINSSTQTMSATIKILKFGTPQTIAIIVLKIEKFDVTLH